MLVARKTSQQETQPLQRRFLATNLFFDYTLHIGTHSLVGYSKGLIIPRDLVRNLLGIYLGENMNTSSAGIGLGSVLAIIISWSLNHSILWAIIHGLFGWFYVIYYVLFLR